MPGRPDWYGTPITHGIDTLYQQTLSIPGNASRDTGNVIPIPRPGYIIQLIPIVGAGASVPFLQVTVRWYAADLTTVIFREDWIIAGATTNANSVMGQGPVRGAGFKVTVANLDLTVAATCSIVMSECTHDIARDDWRSFPGAANPPGFTMAPNNQPAMGVMIATQSVGNFPAGLTTYLLPLYSGVMSFSAESGSANVTIRVLPAVLQVDNFVLGLTASTPVNNELVPLSRQPYILQISNTGTVAATGWINGVMLEYAS